MKKKLLSVLLVLCMVLTLMPMAALADFADTNGHWAKDSIDRWAAVGVLNGKSADNFDPNGQMTRAEFAQMLCNMMGYKKKADNTFNDLPDSAWYSDAMLKLVAAGVINGVGNNMAAPNAPITREMAAVMLCRAFNIKTDTNVSMSFADSGSVSAWAQGAVAALADKGMISGVGNNQIAPQVNINRASVAKLVDNMVADYVTESKTITGEVDGIVVVAAGVDVKIEDATVTAPVVVAPKAEGAEVELTGTTAAENVVVAAAGAEVTVAKDATAEAVTAVAENTKVDVAGSVGTVSAEAPYTTVDVSGTAENVAVSGASAKVDVSGSVGTVSTEAENTKVAVSGTVKNVEVAEGADKAEVNTTSTAKIENVTTAAEEVRVTGSGDVGTVTADAGSVDVSTKGTEVKNEGADSVTAAGKEIEVGGTGTSDGTVTAPPASSGSSSSGSTSTKNDAGLVAAPLADQVAENAIPADKLGTVTVSSKKNASLSSTGDGTVNNVYDVVITGKNIMRHNNAADKNPTNAKHWVGLGMEIETGDDAPTYTYENTVSADNDTIKGRTCVVDGKTYNTIYFDDSDITTNDATVTQTYTDTTGETEVAVTNTYKVTFDVTFWKPTTSIFSISTAPTEAQFAGLGDPATGTVTTLWRHKFAEGLGLDATVKGSTVTLSGTTTTEKLDTTDTGPDGYVSFILQLNKNDYVTDFGKGSESTPFTDAENPTDPGYDTGRLGLPTGSKGIVCNYKIFDNTSGQFANKESTYKVYDAAGREQGQYTVKVDASGCKLEGTKTVTVNFVVGKKTTSQNVTIATDAAADVTIALPALENTANLYFTGAWTIDGEAAPVSGTAPSQTYDVDKDTADGATITLTAVSAPISEAKVTVRPVGPAKGIATEGKEDFDYAAAYEAAGMTYKNNTITVNTPALKKYIEDAQAANAANADALKYITKDASGYHVFFGLSFNLPAGSADATKVYYKKTDGENPAPVVPDAGTFTTVGYTEVADRSVNNEDSFERHFMSYISAGSYTVADSTATFTQLSDNTFNYLLVYTDAEGNVLSIQTATINRVEPDLPAD